MSHTVKIQVQFNVSERAQLEQAFHALGWTVVENGLSKEYYGQKKYDLVAKNPGQGGNDFDVGLNEKNGKYELFTDLWGGSVERSLGQGMSKLRQEFARAVISDEFPNAEINSIKNENGDLILDIGLWQ